MKADVAYIDVKGLQDPFIELLHRQGGGKNRPPVSINAKEVLQPVIGDISNSTAGGSEIDGYPVGLCVTQRLYKTVPTDRNGSRHLVSHILPLFVFLKKETNL